MSTENTKDQRTVNMVHFPNRDATDPRQLDEFLDGLTSGSGGGQTLVYVDTPGGTDNEIAVFNDSDTIEGDANFTWDGTQLTISNGTVGKDALWSATNNARMEATLTEAGDGTDGSANEAGVVVQVESRATSSAADYQKNAAFFLNVTVDPSDTGTPVWRDAVGVDTRGYIANTNATGRVWGAYAEGRIVSGGTGDGQVIGIETLVDNNGTEQATLETDTQKIGHLIVARGSNPSTCAVYITNSDTGTGSWRKGIIVDTTGITNSSDITLGHTDNSFEVSRAGFVKLGGPGSSGATLTPGAENLQITTSATADMGITISDGGTTSKHSIEFRASDDDYGYLKVDHGSNNDDFGVRLGYDDGTSEMAMEIDWDRKEFQFIYPGYTIGAAVVKNPNANDMLVLHMQSIGGMTLYHANGGDSVISFGTLLNPDQCELYYDSGDDEFLIRFNNSTKFRFENGTGGGALKIGELAAANADTAGMGQFWVKDDTPNIPKFTDDAGNDYSIVLDTKSQTLTNKTIQGGIWTQHADNAKDISTGATSYDWTGIPSWVTEIVITLANASTNGTSPWIIQLGDSGGIETSGYIARCRGTSTGTSATNGLIITTANHAAADLLYGEIRLSRYNTDATFTYSSNFVGNARLFVGGGIKTTSAALTQLRLTTVGGTDTFDGGTAVVKYS